MTDAETILKMIETVDPTDTAKLDEIDARVWCWLKGHEYLDIDDDYLEYQLFNVETSSTLLIEAIKDFRATRSRSRQAATSHVVRFIPLYRGRATVTGATSELRRLQASAKLGA
jgi:hypothetical protein